MKKNDLIKISIILIIIITMVTIYFSADEDFKISLIVIYLFIFLVFLRINKSIKKHNKNKFYKYASKNEKELYLKNNKEKSE